MIATPGGTPMPQRAQLASLPEAYEVIKEMRHGESASWGEDVTAAARRAVAQVLEERMALYTQHRRASRSDLRE